MVNQQAADFLSSAVGPTVLAICAWFIKGYFERLGTDLKDLAQKVEGCTIETAKLSIELKSVWKIIEAEPTVYENGRA